MVSLVFSIQNLSRIAVSILISIDQRYYIYVASPSGFIDITRATRKMLSRLVDRL